MPISLKDIDLNLLVIFDELRRQRQVSAAARALGISQPGVSNALNRLRRLLGDDLFVRTPEGMLPTPFAEQLAEPVADALRTLHTALSARTSFDPETSTDIFTVAMSDVGEIYFLAPLMQHLAKVAPNVTLHTVRTTDVDLKGEMQRGTIDLALGFMPDLKAGFIQRRLFRQTYVCMFRQSHPYARSDMTLQQFVEADHVMVLATNTGHGIVNRVLQDACAGRKIRLCVPQFMAVAQVLQLTDMIAVVPERFAQRVAGHFGLCARPCPISMPVTEIHAVWHARKQRDPAHQWLRRVVVELFADD